jgi:ketosteroid isomerase-like protein
MSACRASTVLTDITGVTTPLPSLVGQVREAYALVCNESNLKELIEMKNLLLIIAGSLACLSASATTTAEYAVTDAMNRLSAAMIAGDAQKMRDLTSEKLSYGHSNGRVQDQAAFIGTITSGQTLYRRIDLTHTATTVTGDNAVVRNHFSGTTESDGKFAEVDFDVLLVWQKRNGVWKLLARQGYKY